MNSAELKLKIFRQVDGLDKSMLEGAYGLLANYINGLQCESDWEALSNTQKNGIYKAMDELANGQHILNDTVMDKYKKMYPNE
ncbi:hypothetical protein LX69_02992 [Breznakibacter xylanolyticus]|uniref:Uncharacterized protein n=1 Tax=Breznakibacter xylanolyticus TaxID=990 RepID=A0A2W7MVB3_9BACT|nr:hypothetical protein [Breznakibacter xylanolyticus]PZX11928.1 hypothetical protein LX69_02992 [Breznakibacter xylanolyticus]